MSSHPAFGQPASPQSPEAPSALPNQEGPATQSEPPTVLMASEVAVESEETTTFLNAAILRSRPSTALAAIENQLPLTEERTRALVKTTEEELDAHVSLSDLTDLKSSLNRQESVLRGLRDQISADSKRLEESLREVRRRYEVWQLTREAGFRNDYPAEVLELINGTLAALDQGREKIGERRSQLLSLQNSVVASRGLIHESLLKVAATEEAHRKRLFTFRGSPLLDLYQIDATGMWERLLEQMARNSASFRDYALTTKHWILASFLFLVIASLWLRGVRKRLLDGLPAESLKQARMVLDHPFSSTGALVLFLNSIFHPDAPHSWFNLLVLIGLVVLLRLLPGFVPSQVASLSMLLLGLRALQLVNSLVPEETPLGRLLTIVVVVLPVMPLFWLKRRLKQIPDIGKRWANVLHWACWAGLSLLGLAFLSAMLGNLTLAGLLAGGTIRTAFGAVAFWVGFCILRAMLVLGIRSLAARSSRFFRTHQDLILLKTTRVAGVFVALVFAVSVPRTFAVLDPLSESVAAVATAPLELGAFSLSLGDIVAFVLVVWLSFQFSRLVCFLLEEDFLPRFTLAKGAPAAISRLAYYTILFLGFVIALTAGGFDLSRITILLSAFGVGIGFGLQNIVNNFVSGLVLLFERPVRVGDRIQLARDLTGEVIRIGIRASVVKTFEGAEVLVPNGHLISNELTNWTLSDPRRRIEVSVGVAYGTDPQRVVDLLREVAAAHPEVLPEPAPFALFRGFGESSLDFSLRAWVASFDMAFQVASELRIAVARALHEAGIEIPFPQRDLHLRSVTGDLKLQAPPSPGRTE